MMAGAISSFSMLSWPRDIERCSSGRNDGKQAKDHDQHRCEHEYDDRTACPHQARAFQCCARSGRCNQSLCQTFLIVRIIFQFRPFPHDGERTQQTPQQCRRDANQENLVQTAHRMESAALTRRQSLPIWETP